MLGETAKDDTMSKNIFFRFEIREGSSEWFSN